MVYHAAAGNFLAMKYERFRPKLEKMINEGTVAAYMHKRLLTTREGWEKAEPPISIIDYEEESPEWILQYFAGQNYPTCTRSKKPYPAELYAAARSLLKGIASDHELARNEQYVKGLAWLLEEGKDNDAGEIALDVLLAGGKDMAELQLKTGSDRWLLRLFAAARKRDLFDCLPCEKKDEAKALFLGYIMQCPDLADIAGRALLKIDYDEGIRTLQLVIDQTPTPAYFGLDWALVNVVKPAKLARDIVNAMDGAHIDYFMRSLKSHSGGFKGERSLAFKTALEGMTGRAY